MRRGMLVVREPHVAACCQPFRKALRDKASLWATPPAVYFFNREDEVEYYSRVRFCMRPPAHRLAAIPLHSIAARPHIKERPSAQSR